MNKQNSAYNDKYWENFNYGEALAASLEQVIEKTRVRVAVRELPIPEYDAHTVAIVRKKLNLSQRGLASALGVSTRTVESWENGRNVPNGSARNLLYLLEKDESLLEHLVIKTI